MLAGFTRPVRPLLSAASRSRVRFSLPPPYARNALNRCRRSLPPSSHPPALVHPARRYSPSARSPEPFPLATLRRGPVTRNSATGGLHASSFQCRDPRTPSPPKTRSSRPTAARPPIRRPAGFPAEPCQSPAPAIRALPVAASRAPDLLSLPEPSAPRHQNILPAPHRNPSKECRLLSTFAPPTVCRAPLPD